MTDEILCQRALAYADRRQMQLGRQLGFGTHGAVYAAQGKLKPLRSAIKIYKEQDPFDRERKVYERLAEHEVTEIEGFHVPQLLGVDSELLIVEMTVVARPFVLDFAGAYLDRVPEFPAGVMEDWEADKREQFGPRWVIVESILQILRSYGVHLLDIHPNNIAFLDRT
jgi:serine/threonine protein kinase